jgi:diphthine synthase
VIFPVLTFIGLGLYDLDDISLRGISAIEDADEVFLEGYTSVLTGTTPEALAERYGKPVRVLKRENVEIRPDPILDAAMTGNAVFLTPGDSMVSTTHADLRLRAWQRGIPTRIIHGASIQTAVCGLSGLQNYRFGKSCSVPFPQGTWAPETPFDVIAGNRQANLHTLVYLDIQDRRFMRIFEAVSILEGIAARRNVRIPLYVGIARAGAPDVTVAAGPAEKMLAFGFGGPLHILIVPGELHQVEEEYLTAFAGL